MFFCNNLFISPYESWSTHITASTDIQEKDIDDIVDNLPEELSNTLIMKNDKQSWGWSCGVLT